MRIDFIPALAGAAILVFLVCEPAAAGDAKQKAKEHFDKGVELFKNTDYSGALVEFKAAYKAQPHFAVRYNVGITLYKLKRYGDAHVELSAYLAEGGDEIPADKKQEVDEILLKLKSLLGTLEVNTNVEGAVLFIDGEPSASWIVQLEVGEYEVGVEAPGHDPFKKIVELPGGESVLVDATFEVEGAAVKPGEEPTSKKKPKKERGKLPPSALWASLGVTAAVGIAAAVTGGMAVMTNKDYKDLTYEDENWESIQEKGRNLSLATDVLLGITGAAAVTTIIIAVFTDFGKEEKVSVIVTPSPEGLCVGLQGAF